MDSAKILARYLDAQQYVGWTAEDAERVRGLEPLLAPHIDPVIVDFYDTIERHPDARSVISGGAEQIARLKERLREWILQLLSGNYDEDYAARRWRVGLRHVEIGLDQQFTIVALARVRSLLMRSIREHWTGGPDDLIASLESLHRALDLDLVLIECAYQHAYLQRQQRSDRLVAIGQMASGIAHELRNPLNVIRTSVFYLQHARNPSDEKRTEHLERIQRQVALSDDVITALSDFARLPLPVFEPVSVPELFDEALANTTVPKEIRVDRRGSEPPLCVFGDRRQLCVVFSNLIRNAVESMPQGGRLELRVGPANGHVEISVTDTGTGISSDDLTRVFEPFYSTKARGIGLGLAITRAIVENHRGQLLVTSVIEQGSCFVVRLPATTCGTFSTSSAITPADSRT